MAQKAHEASCAGRVLTTLHRSVDKVAAVPLDASSVRHAIYVDNYLMIGHDAKQVVPPLTRTAPSWRTKVYPFTKSNKVFLRLIFVAFTWMAILISFVLVGLDYGSCG